MNILLFCFSLLIRLFVNFMLSVSLFTSPEINCSVAILPLAVTFMDTENMLLVLEKSSVLGVKF